MSAEAAKSPFAHLSNDELRRELTRNGIPCGPITAANREEWERQLQNALGGNPAAENGNGSLLNGSASDGNGGGGRQRETSPTADGEEEEEDSTQRETSETTTATSSSSSSGDSSDDDDEDGKRPRRPGCIYRGYRPRVD